MTLDRRRSMRVERFDRLQSPRLPLRPLGFTPHDRLPIRREDQPRPGIGHFDAIAARLVDVQKKGLLDRVLMRAGLDEHTILEKDIGGAQNFFAAVERVSDVMKAPARAGVVARIGEIVALIRECDSHRGFTAVVQNDLLGETAAEIVLEKLAVGFDVDGQPVEMVQTANVGAARGENRWAWFSMRA